MRACLLVVVMAATTPTGALAQTTASAPPVFDAASFKHVRPLPEGPTGLVAIAVDAAMLAGSAGPSRHFADVRILDSAGHQLPYIVEQLETPLRIDIPRVRTTSAAADRLFGVVPQTAGGHGTVSAYRLPLSPPVLPRSSVTLDTSARVFDRWVAIGAERAPDAGGHEAWIQQLARDRWTHDDPNSAATPLRLFLSSVDTAAVVIAIDEGDNAALPLTAAYLNVPGYRLRFYRQSNQPLRLAYGRDDLAEPKYDLALQTDRVLSEPAVTVIADHEATSHVSQMTVLNSPWLFWSVLTLAVLVILGLIVRLTARG